MPSLYIFWPDKTNIRRNNLKRTTYNLLHITLLQKQLADISHVLKDSDTEPEKLSSLVLLSVSDSQKPDSSSDVSFIGK